MKTQPFIFMRKNNSDTLSFSQNMEFLYFYTNLKYLEATLICYLQSMKNTEEEAIISCMSLPN